MKEQQTRLGGNHDFHLIRDLQAPATLKVFLRHKYLDVALQLFLIRFRQLREQWKRAFQDGAPCGWEGLRSQPISSSALEYPKHGASVVLSYHGKVVL